jgi:polyhydroxyalkanoate synthesis regulator phasin
MGAFIGAGFLTRNKLNSKVNAVLTPLASVAEDSPGVERNANMKSLLQKTVYAGLGLLGTGKQTINQLGRELSKKANLSEKEGQKVARQLRSRSEKAIKSLRKTLDTEVDKVVHALHVATIDDVAELARAKPAKKPRRRRPAKPKPSV